jgi:hypothetical protein
VLSAVAVALAVAVPLTAHAQRGRGRGGGEKPAVNIVQSTGCAERRAGTPETWWLVQATEPRISVPGLFNANQIEEAKKSGLGAQSFQLVGVADFLDTESLLKTGQRKEFTTAETANATNELRAGRKVLVKGMLIETSDPKRINLLAVIGVGESCG